MVGMLIDYRMCFKKVYITAMISCYLLEEINSYSVWQLPVAKPAHQFGHAMQILNYYHYSFLYKLIVFTVYEHGNICIAWPNCRAGFATDSCLTLDSRFKNASTIYTMNCKRLQNTITRLLSRWVHCFNTWSWLKLLSLSDNAWGKGDKVVRKLI
jgi:hypothetical protein